MELTYVGRASDGLVLCESWSNGSTSRKFQAKQLLKTIGRNLRKGSEIRGSLDCNDGYFWHYFLNNGIVYMTLCPRSFNRRTAFLFLDNLSREFQEEMQLDFGTAGIDYASRIETIERPHYFVKFDRRITRCKKEVQNPASGAALQKLNESLAEVTSIMKENVNEVLQRGENLQQVGEKSEHLKLVSSQFARQAKVLSFRALLQKYVPIVVVSGMLMLVVGWKFFL